MAVKADVYAPDWRDERRVDYTLGLVDILTRLLRLAWTVECPPRRCPTKRGCRRIARGLGHGDDERLARVAGSSRASANQRDSSFIWISSRSPTACSKPWTRQSISSSNGCGRTPRSWSQRTRDSSAGAAHAALVEHVRVLRLLPRVG